MAKFNVGDKVLVLPGNYRSGKIGTVVGIQDGDPAVQLEGLPEPEMFAEWELRLEKSLPATKALENFKIGDLVEVHYGGGQWYPGKVTNRATDSRGVVYAVEPDGGGLVYAREGNIRAKSLPTTGTKALLRAKYSKSVYATGRSGDEQAAYIRAKNKYVGRGAVVGGKNGQIIEVIVERNGDVAFDVELDGGEVLHSLPLNRLEIY